MIQEEHETKLNTRGKGRGRSPNSLKNLIPFKPGQSGNPKGRPPNFKYVSEALKDLLASDKEKDKALVGALAENLGKRILDLRKVRKPYQ